MAPPNLYASQTVFFLNYKKCNLCYLYISSDIYFILLCICHCFVLKHFSWESLLFHDYETNTILFAITLLCSFSDHFYGTLLCEAIEGIERPGSMIDLCPRTDTLCKRSPGFVFAVVARDQKQDTPFKVARLRCGRVGFEFPATVAARLLRVIQTEGPRGTLRISFLPRRCACRNETGTRDSTRRFLSVAIFLRSGVDHFRFGLLGRPWIRRTFLGYVIYLPKKLHYVNCRAYLGYQSV